MSLVMENCITIRGARENNLKNISLSIPKNKLVVLTGLSGSGKSTLAFDTLQKECMRQYMESMGMVTDFLSKPKVDSITGLSPSISVDQHLSNRSPRSTVGTATEVFTYLRVLFAKLGKRPCPKCGDIIEPSFENTGGGDIEIWDGSSEDPEVVLGEEEIEGGTAVLRNSSGNTFPCPHCQTPVPEMSMANFSFNKPDGACPTCTGLGVVSSPILSSLVDEELSIIDGAVPGWDQFLITRYATALEAAGRHYGFSFDSRMPVKELQEVQKDLLFYGVQSTQLRSRFPDTPLPDTVPKGRFEGLVTNLMRRYAEYSNDARYREKIEKMLVRDVNVNIPLGTLTAVTGVSGSGKSTLMFDIVDKAARKYFYNANEFPGRHHSINGWEHIDKVITIDQTPIGRTPRSNAATYTDAFTAIRNVFAELPGARENKLQARHFSFNTPGGRCDRCQGAGVLTVKMHFLPDVQVRCPVCHGRRFKREVLSVKYDGYDISDILNMTIQEALPLFENVRAVNDRLSVMSEVGLGYLQLGQPATTLSGGEAQRIKLARELGSRAKGHTLYLLDEPTSGLHPHDVSKLITLLQKLVEAGNTVVVIEHNLDVISMASWVIDFGPEGGYAGGEVIAEGTPEQVALVEKSRTGNYLKRLFRNG